MSTEQFGWDLDFRMKTDTVKRGTKDLITLNGELAKTKAWMLEFETRDGSKGMINMSLAAQQAGSALKNGLAVGLAAVGAALVGGIVLLDKFGDSAVKAFSERGSSIRAYATLLGSAKQAELEFYKSQQLSAQTDFTAADTRKAQQKLIVSGFSGQGLDSTLLAGMDVAALQGENRGQALESFASAISKMKGAGKLDAGLLTNELETSGLSASLVKDEIGKLLGLKDRKAIDKAISGGKVDSDAGLLAIQSAVLAQTHSQKLGQYSSQSAGSVGSLLSNRDEAVTNLLQSFDSDKLPAVAQYKKSLANYTEALNVQTDTGGKLSIALQDLANTSIGLKSGFEDFKTGFLESFADSYAEALEAFGGPLEDTTGNLNNTGAALKEVGLFLGQLGYVVAALNRGLEHTGEVIDLTTEALGEFWFYLRNPAKWLAGGEQGESWRQILGMGERKKNAFDGADDPLAVALNERKSKGTESEADYRKRMAEDFPGDGEQAGEGFGKALVKGARNATKTHSPSEEMRSFGRDLRAGLSLGLADSGGDVAGRASAEEGTGAGDITVNVYAAAGQSEEEIAELAVDKIMRAIGRHSRYPGKGSA